MKIIFAGKILSLCLFFTCSCDTGKVNVAKTAGYNSDNTNVMQSSVNDSCRRPAFGSEDFQRTFQIDWNIEQSWNKNITEKGYCLASASDFNIPISAARTEEEKNQIERWKNSPYSANEMSDVKFIAVVVKPSLDVPDKFGLVIFQKPKSGQISNPIWVYKNVNLSTTLVTGASGYTILRDYNKPDIQGCFLMWNEKKLNYDCNKRS